MKKYLLPILIGLGLIPAIVYAVIASPNVGGTGTGVVPTIGQVLVGQSNGTYLPQATSTLGISGGGSVSTSSATSTGYFVNWVSPSGVSLSSSIWQSSSTGYVGVNNTNPSYSLDVTGGFRASANSTFSGNVSIGTSTSVTKETIVGNGDVNYGQLSIKSSNTNYGGLTFLSQLGGATEHTWMIQNNYAAQGDLDFYYSNNATSTPAGTLFMRLSPGDGLVLTGLLAQGGALNCTLGVVTNGNGVFTGCVSSDEKLKKNIKSFASSGLGSSDPDLALPLINKLQPITYNWISTSTHDAKTHLGFLAEQVQSIDPDAVSAAGKDASGTALWGVDPNSINALVVKGLQELYADFQNMVAAISGVQSELQTQQDEITVLQQQIKQLQNK